MLCRIAGCTRQHERSDRHAGRHYVAVRACLADFIVADFSSSVGAVAAAAAADVVDECSDVGKGL